MSGPISNVKSLLALNDLMKAIGRSFFCRMLSIAKNALNLDIARLSLHLSVILLGDLAINYDDQLTSAY